jgi:hypothetical protein
MFLFLFLSGFFVKFLLKDMYAVSGSQTDSYCLPMTLQDAYEKCCRANYYDILVDTVTDNLEMTKGKTRLARDAKAALHQNACWLPPWKQATRNRARIAESAKVDTHTHHVRCCFWLLSF